MADNDNNLLARVPYIFDVMADNDNNLLARVPYIFDVCTKGGEGGSEKWIIFRGFY